MSIHEDTKYQYIRLNDGKEMFAMVSEMGDKVEMYLPMSLMCKTSTTGPGVTIHLGPMIPFTNDEFVTINIRDISFRTSITEQFIAFYDEAVTNWLDLRASGKMSIRTEKQEYQEQSDLVKNMIQERLRNTLDWDDYDNELEDDFIENKDLPSEKDIIH